jgi:hypothetical protein
VTSRVKRVRNGTGAGELPAAAGSGKTGIKGMGWGSSGGDW